MSVTLGQTNGMWAAQSLQSLGEANPNSKNWSDYSNEQGAWATYLSKNNLNADLYGDGTAIQKDFTNFLNITQSVPFWKGTVNIAGQTINKTIVFGGAAAIIIFILIK